jgi:hypothetical protein
MRRPEWADRAGSAAGATGPSEEAEHVARGLAHLEGYLRYQSEIRAVALEAEAFAEHMPWLTAVQREEVVRRYADTRLELSRRMLERVVERCTELRGEYSARYEQLRRRLVCMCVLATLCAFALGVFATVLAAAA